MNASEEFPIIEVINLAAIMLRDIDGTIRFWSKGCGTLYGWSAQEAIGQHAHRFLKTVFPVSVAVINHSLTCDGEWIGKLRQTGRDGKEVYVAARKVLRRDRDSKHSVAIVMENVATLRETDRAPTENEIRLRLVQEVGKIAYTDRILDNDAGLISKEFADLYGLESDQTGISPPEWDALLHPDDRDRAKAEAGRLRDAGGTLDTKFRIQRKGGSIRWIAMRAETFPAPGGKGQRLITAHRDITDQACARESLERDVAQRTAALVAAEARFRAIFNSQFQFIGLLAIDGTLLEANRTALKAGGLSAEEVIGKPFWETGWWPPSEHEILRRDIARAAQGVPTRREVEVNGADGQGIWLDFSLKPLRDPTTGVVAFIVPEGRDITEERALLTRLVQLQKVQALGQLAGGIAHDFNNILQTVSGAAMLIEEQPDDLVKVRRLARTLTNAATRGASITRRLLSFGRHSDMRAERIDPAELIHELRDVLDHTIGRVVSVRTLVPVGLPMLLADRAQLETALINLATNARDAMPDGGTLTISADSADVTETTGHPTGLQLGTYVTITVADTGTEIDTATLSKVAEPFFTTKAAGQGTGLGLAIVREFAEQSGGGLAITSTPGTGTYGDAVAASGCHQWRGGPQVRTSGLANIEICSQDLARRRR